jgi:hypothetical protein
MNELKIWEQHQKAIFDGAQEAARLDAQPEPAFVPYGRCQHHPSVSTFEHGFDIPCYVCEAAMEEM